MFVFPAHAGMSRDLTQNAVRAVRFPRSRGDEPWGREKAKAETLFSPLTRG